MTGPADGKRPPAGDLEPADGGSQPAEQLHTAAGSRQPAVGLRPGALPADLARALEELRGRRPDLAFDVRWHASLPSTMDVVSAAAELGAPAGLTVVADEQTAGRGRRGQVWSSPAGAGLYLSYLHRPRRSVELVTLAAGVAVREAVLRACGLAAHLKWPNDLQVGARKLAGLLAEGTRIGNPDAAITIGIGLNLHPASYPPDVEARSTCLAREGVAVDRGAVLAAILVQLADTLARLDAGGGSDILQEWRAASPLSLGTPVEWSDAASAHRGMTAGLDETGALLVETANGLERVVGGGLRWTLPDA